MSPDDSLNKTVTDENFSPSDQEPRQTADTAASDGLKIGALFCSRYLIERELGRGGIGVVYLARDHNLLSKQVVVKVLLEKSLQDNFVVQKFKQEMEALTRIEHSGVIGILDAGKTERGEPFIVMQYVEGVNLRCSIQAGEGMAFERIADIMRQIGEALSVAHAAGVLHRDLKPENIMLRHSTDGREQVILIDFGIAKVKASLLAPSTATSITLGTYAYMSPEQLNAKPVSTASDVYALGIIAYEMVTGLRPFKPESPFQLGEMQRAGVRVAPRELRPGLTEAAQAVILKALGYAPKERYQKAKEFGDALYRAIASDDETNNDEANEKPNKNSPNAGASQYKTVPMPGVEHETQKNDARHTMNLGHVLFTDIVGYSKLPIDEQQRTLADLQRIVRSTLEFNAAEATDKLIRLPTGDGMALVFFGDMEAAVRCALEISRELKTHSHIKLRMGVNSGPVELISDVNDKPNVAGAGINMAQRVMDCGDAGHILLSKRVADDLGQYSRWQPLLHDLGEAEVKHGVRIHVFNLYDAETGNAEIPQKLQTPPPAPRPKKLRAMVIGVLSTLILAALVVWFVRSTKTDNIQAENSKTDGNANSSAIKSAASERSLNYWIDVQKYRNGKPDKEPFRLAGEMIFQVGDHIWFNFNSSQSGYLYIINEGPETKNDLPEYNVLFPTPTANNNSSALAANQTFRIPGGKGFVIDDERGTEKLWFIWSVNRFDELEATAKSAWATNPPGSVADAAQIKMLQAILNKDTASEVKKDDAQKLTSVRGNTDVVTTMRQLEHY